MKIEVSRKSMLSNLCGLPQPIQEALMESYDLVDSGFESDEDGNIFDHIKASEHLLDDCLVGGYITQELHYDIKRNFIDALEIFSCHIINN